MTAPEPTPTAEHIDAVALDLDGVVAEFLRQCGGCDAGLMVGCTCSQRDFRPTMLALVAEVRRLTRLGQCDLDLLMRAEAAEAEVVTLRARLAAVEAHPVVIELAEERTRQTAKHGDQSHLPDGTGATLPNAAQRIPCAARRRCKSPTVAASPPLQCRPTRSRRVSRPTGSRPPPR